MISQVQFGSLFDNGNGKTVIGGSATGYDTQALVEELSNAKRLPAVQLESRLEDNALKQTAFGEMRAILNRFRESANLLRNPPGVQNAANNIFEYRKGLVSSNSAVDASNYLDVTVEPGTDLSEYDISIDQIATYNLKTTNTFALENVDTDAVGLGLPFNAGLMSLGPNAVNVVINEDDTLKQIVDKINTVSDQSFVRASILQVSDGNFRMQLRTTKTGTEYNYQIDPPIYRQSGNEVIIEAETYRQAIARGDDSFATLADAAASNGEYIEAGPNDDTAIIDSFATTAPETNYQVRLDSAGTYYVHILGRGDAADDSLHIGVNGIVQETSEDINGFDAANFVWGATNKAGDPASITVDSAGDYMLNLYMGEDGTDIDKIILTTDVAYVPAGNAQASTIDVNGGIFNIGFAIEQDASDAMLTIDNTTITRSSNNIDDLIDGATFNLKQPTPLGTELKVDIQPDLEVLRGGIISFIDSYNELRVFAAKQSERDEDGVPVEGAVLSRNSTLRTLSTSLLNELSNVVDGLSQSPNRLSDLGISLDDFAGDEETPFTRNILVLDQDKLDSALQANFDAVRNVFEFDFSSDNTEVQIFKRGNASSIREFDLNIDITNEIYQATYLDKEGISQTIDLEFSPINGGGVLLKGTNDSVLSGLQLIYSGTSDTLASVNYTQGIGDRLYNSLNASLAEDGIVAAELEGITESNDRLQKDIDRIDRIVDRFRVQQLQRFAALEAAVSSINTLLQSLQAQADARAG